MQRTYGDYNHNNRDAGISCVCLCFLVFTQVVRLQVF